MAGYGATVTLYARRIRGFQPLYYRTDGARWWAWNPMLCTWDGIDGKPAFTIYRLREL